MKTNLKLVTSTPKKSPKVMKQKSRMAAYQEVAERDRAPHDNLRDTLRQPREKMVKPSQTLQTLMDGICDFPDELFNEEVRSLLNDAWAKLQDAQLELEYAGL